MKQSSVEWLYNNLLLNPISNEDIEYNEAVFENAKVLDAQQKRSYSEEDMQRAFMEGHNICRCVTDNIDEAKECFIEWFEQFKKK